MRNKIKVNHINNLSVFEQRKGYPLELDEMQIPETDNMLPEILFITSYPPRECGIATYSQDLIMALNNKFNHSFRIQICPLETENEKHNYSDEIKYILNTDSPNAFSKLAKTINDNTSIEIVMIQHEFGLFKKNEDYFNLFLNLLTKPVVIVFHTVLPNPSESLKLQVQEINEASESIIVMTNSSAQLLINDYGVTPEKITVISHGTHLVTHSDKEILKNKHGLSGKKILSTFGLLSSGKSIETTLEAMPAIIKKNPDVLFLIIGKTHPTVKRQEGEIYREMLKAKVAELQLEQYVRFMNIYLALPDLLEYLQLTDIYLFTSKDPNQTVSGTFSYAISCGCPIICTPIPHASEVLRNDAGITIGFGNSQQLEEAVINLLNDEQLRKNFSSNGLHRMASTAWENAAIAHAMLFEKLGNNQISLLYTIPPINLDHIKKLTTSFGMIQFSKINQPDIDSGYTLDDNARAMIAMCQHFELTKDQDDLKYIHIYFNFIKHCLQSEGYFLNYVNEDRKFTKQNNSTNLADANGRAIWALGYLISMSDLLSEELTEAAESTLQSVLSNVNKIHSTRAMAFVIKGLYYRNTKNKSSKDLLLIKELANRLVQMYRHEADEEWHWFESYLTYANSILSEAMLCAWLATGELIYKEIAKSSFDFLLSQTFRENGIKVISNKTWLHKGTNSIQAASNNYPIGGEQPIDVAYTIIALSKFHDVFEDEGYLYKMEMSFNWFLGNNHLNQIIYNPCTGGCYDGLEENYVNLNQGAESTISYLMARLAIEKSFPSEQKIFQIPITLRANTNKKKHFLELNE
ncbi:glycosyltransferase [Flavobacterium sp.]|uniref:glycosyltransferase n=1 Tax=Flavobacterium sp. TaxID=239 RepID=UPI002B4B8667|nr:glycosyltransferase [Flavobacterium sp.]HLF53080.1 glycosyltransferase [Flavobacterium sp.]